MTRAVIGITGRRGSGLGEFPENLAHLRTDVFVTDYARAVAETGALPVLISREAGPAELVEQLDGLVIAGGQDVDPRRYGAVPNARSTLLDPARDSFEIDLVRTAVALGRPVLAICRGVQLLNVAFGGTLVADLEVGVGESHSFLGYPPAHRSHPVHIGPGSRLAELVGDELMVNSYHHQCIDRVGDGLVAVAHAPDGVVEAVERPGADVLGVQWHPEMLPGPDPVFSWLSHRCTTLKNSEADRAVA